MSGPAVSRQPPAASRAPRPSGLAGRFLENPLLRRELAVGMGGGKLALVFLLVNGALLVTTASTVVATVEGEFRGTQAALGRIVFILNVLVTYGLLAILLPLRTACLIERLRLDHSFDQLVASGVPPGRLHVGNWAQAMLYALVVLASTLPYHAFASACGGVEAGDIAGTLALLIAYSNVMVLLSMALGMSMTEILSVPVSMLIFLGLGLVTALPLPGAVAQWTPLRSVIEEALALETGPLGRYYGSPVLYGAPIPDGAMMAALWGLLVLWAAVPLVLGPVHAFSPGLNNFGAVVLPGDRKRSRLRTVRFHLTRQVEMAFLYLNRPRRWIPWAWALRSALVLLSVSAWWTLVTGSVFPVGGGWAGRTEELGLLVFFAGLGLLAILPGESRGLLHAREQVGPLRLSRGVLSLVHFTAGLALFWTVVYLTGAHFLAAVPASPGLSSFQGALAWAMLVLSVFAFTVYLLGRILARTVWVPSRLHGLHVVSTLLLIIVPPLGSLLWSERVVEARWVGQAAFASPTFPLIEVLSPRDNPLKELGSARAAFFWIHGFLDAVLMAMLFVMRRGERGKGGRLNLAGAAAPALAALLAAGAGGFHPGGLQAGEVSAEVVRGFGGVSLSTGEHFTVVLSRPEAAGSALPLEVTLEDETFRERLAQARVELPPGTRTVLRLVAEPQGRYWRVNPLRLTAAWPGGRLEVQVPAQQQHPLDAARFLIVSEEGKVPSLALSGHHWAGCRPEWLPERSEPYAGFTAVLVGPVGLSTWTAGQRRALYDFVRAGGTVVFFGARDERDLAAAEEWKTLLAASEPARTEARTIPFHLRPLEGGRVTWKWGEGTDELPLLWLKSLGVGWVGHLAVDPLQAVTAQALGGPERFWSDLAQRVPSSLPGVMPWIQRVGAPPRARAWVSLLAVALYFLAYAFLLGPVLFFLFRSRRRRPWAWTYAPGLSLAFVAGSPLLFLVMESSPSAADARSFVLLGEEGGAGVRHDTIAVSSSGRQAHRLTLTGEDLTALATSPVDGLQRWRTQDRLGLLARARGPGPLSAAFDTVPWGSRLLHLEARQPGTAGPGVQGRAAWTQGVSGKSWQYQVEGLGRPRQAWVLVLNTQQGRGHGFAQGRPPRVAGGEEEPQEVAFEEITTRVRGGSISGRISGPSVANSIIWSLGFTFITNRLERPRAFVLWSEEVLPPLVDSRDLTFEDPVPAIWIKEIEVLLPGEEDARATGRR